MLRCGGTAVAAALAVCREAAAKAVPRQRWTEDSGMVDPVSLSKRKWKPKRGTPGDAPSLGCREGAGEANKIMGTVTSTPTAFQPFFYLYKMIEALDFA